MATRGSTVERMLDELGTHAQARINLMQREGLLPFVMPKSMVKGIMNKFKKYAFTRKMQNRIARLNGIQQVKQFMEAYSASRPHSDQEVIEERIIRLVADVMEKSTDLSDDDFLAECNHNFTRDAPPDAGSSSQEPLNVEVKYECPFTLPTPFMSDSCSTNREDLESTNPMPPTRIVTPVQHPPTPINTLLSESVQEEPQQPPQLPETLRAVTTTDFRSTMVPLVEKLPGNILEAHLSGKRIVLIGGHLLVKGRSTRSRSKLTRRRLPARKCVTKNRKIS